MEISSVSAGGGAAQVQGDASTLVARKVLDATRQEGEQMVKLIEQAGGVGRNVDVRA